LSQQINKLKSIVNFYSLEKTEDIYLCICRLVRKLYKENKKIIIIENDNKLESIDKLLWSFEQNTFLPHKIHSSDGDIDTPILLISSQYINKLQLFDNYSEIINNCEIPLIENNTYTNIHELVSDSEEHKIICRNKYTQYMNNNFDVTHRKYNE
tara:strand:- start:2329 stop:2790 length:462 start_codon:yes stop_codon:yes gene_type:complete